MVVDIVAAPTEQPSSTAPKKRGLCPPAWACAVAELVTPIVNHNFRMFEHFPEIDEQDILNEAELAACRAYQKFDARKTLPSHWIRQATRSRLIDIYRQTTLKHKRDRDYAPRMQSRTNFDSRAFAARLGGWIRREEENRLEHIKGDIQAIVACYRLLARSACRLEQVPGYRSIPHRLKKRVDNETFNDVLQALIGCVKSYCDDSATPITTARMDNDTAEFYSSAYAIGE